MPARASKPKLPRARTVNDTNDRLAKGGLGERADTLELIDGAMRIAARQAVEENDRLGIPTPGADSKGRITMRTPPRRSPRAQKSR